MKDPVLQYFINELQALRKSKNPGCVSTRDLRSVMREVRFLLTLRPILNKYLGAKTRYYESLELDMERAESDPDALPSPETGLLWAQLRDVHDEMKQVYFADVGSKCIKGSEQYYGPTKDRELSHKLRLVEFEDTRKMLTEKKMGRGNNGRVRVADVHFYMAARHNVKQRTIRKWLQEAKKLAKEN